MSTDQVGTGPKGAEAASTDRPLSHLRICDLSGLLAGAGATRFLAAFGAQVIRVEQPLGQPRWDFLRGGFGPDGEYDINRGGNFNTNNVEKLSVTIDLQSADGQVLLARLVEVSDVVTENFSAGIMERFGFTYDRLRELNEKIIYVSNSGFGKTGPYSGFRSVGQIAQAVCGLTFVSGLPDLPPAGWGFAYMDHMGAYFMAMAVLGGVIARNRTGEGQWIDFSCSEAGIGLAGPDLLDAMVNGRPMRRPGRPSSNEGQSPTMVPHGVYPAAGDDSWIAVACRGDADWDRLRRLIDQPWADVEAWRTLAGRLAARTTLDEQLAGWTRTMTRREAQDRLVAAGVPAAEVATPEDRIEHDARTEGLFPWVHHPVIGDVRVEGVPMHLSETDWSITRGAPCLGQDNDRVFRGLLGVSADELGDLQARGVI